MNDPWCNGNTTDFGSVILGSSPSGSTKKLPCSEEAFFIWSIVRSDLEGHHRPYRMVYQILGGAAVKEMRETSTAVSAHAN